MPLYRSFVLLILCVSFGLKLSSGVYPQHNIFTLVSNSLPRLRLMSRRKERCLPITCCTMLYLLGTGSFELRGDGSIHEWTIENQTPAGSAKLNFAALELAVFSIRVKTGTSSSAALLRTHPPMGYPGNLRSLLKDLNAKNNS